MKLNTNGITINYELDGEGACVALSHSLACNLHMWDEQARALARRYRVLRFDTRGHGASEAPDGAYTFDQMAEDVHGLLAGLGIDEVHFVGLSLGGMIGQTFALKYPAMIASLVLCDTTSRYPVDAAGVWQERVGTVAAHGMEPLVEPTLARWFTEPFLRERKDVTERVAQMIRSTSPKGYIGCCHAIPTIDLTARLHELRCPVQVIVGEQDVGTPVAMAREIHAAIADSELVVIPAASHLSNVEQPELFTRALLDFLDRARASAHSSRARS